MNRQIDDLINVLGEMIKVFERLLAVAADKQRQMILLDMNSLERTTREEGELLDYIVDLEKSSRSILHDINKVFFKTNALVLRKLIELGRDNDFDGAARLTSVYEDLIAITGKLKEVNDKNQQMADLSLETVRDTVRFICRETTTGVTYKKSGRYGSAESLLSLVDTQA